MIVAIILLHLYFIHSLLSLYSMIMYNQNAETAKHIAGGSKGFIKIVKLLVDKGATVSITDSVSHCMCCDVSCYAMLCCAVLQMHANQITLK